MKKLHDSPAMICEARQKSSGHIWIAEILIFALVFIVGSALEGIPASVASFIWVLTDPDFLTNSANALLAGNMDFAEYFSDVINHIPSWIMLVTLYATVLMTATVILYCRWIEKRGLPTLGFRRENALREYGAGIAAGFITISAAVGIGLATGAYTIEAVKFSPALVLLYLLGYILQGMSEEVLCRGYLMVSIARKNPTWLAVILSALVFAALHLANPGITWLALGNIFLCGIVFSVYVLRRGNLWGACAMHSFWNFFQGNFYGFSVSGSTQSKNAMIFHVILRENAARWSGGDFGIEGGLGVTIALLAALVVLLFFVPACKTPDPLQ